MRNIKQFPLPVMFEEVLHTAIAVMFWCIVATLSVVWIQFT